MTTELSNQDEMARCDKIAKNAYTIIITLHIVIIAILAVALIVVILN